MVTFLLVKYFKASTLRRSLLRLKSITITLGSAQKKIEVNEEKK